MSVPAVDWTRARSTLEATARHAAELVAAVRDPSAQGTGDWTAAETAAHLTHSYGVNLGVARGLIREVPEDLSRPETLVPSVATVNASHLAPDPERDLGGLRPRSQQRAAEC